MKSVVGNFPLKFAVIYAGFSGLWIAGSDQVVQLLFPEIVSTAQTFKGSAFVLCTTVLLFLLLRGELNRRTKIETRLRDSERKFRAIAETAPVALLIARLRDGVILFSNATANGLCGRDGTPLDGLDIRDLGFVPNDREEWRRALIGRNGTGQTEGRLSLANGEERRLLVFFQKVRLAGETVLVTAAVDISERHRAAETVRNLQSELAHASRVSAMGEMAAQFAHELSQPLTAISTCAEGGVDALFPPGRNPDNALTALRLIVTQAKRASEIIRRTRKFIQKHEQEKVPADVNSLIRDAAELIQGEANHRNVDMRLRLAELLPAAFVDVVQIQQVIVNLARNGIEAMSGNEPTRRQLVISTEPSPDGIVVSVEDSGPGISPEIRTRLFEPFFSTKSDGLGIGLSICRSIVEAHGAHLVVSSAPGHGAQFRFALPSLAA
ncbi:MAG: PAS domain S-box protein [Rhodospirillales bacterium]|nr:PAS domain S-box protein [Rhodospirillales bacterium]